MSKLRDRIRDISRRRPAPFGFAAMRATESASSRQILVLAEVDSAADAGRAVSAGADALVFTGALSHLGEVVAAAGKAITGARVDNATPQDVAAIREAGADFLVCTDNGTDAAALLDQQVGYVVLAETPVTPVFAATDQDASLRLLRPLDLDGVIVQPLPQTMTVRQQLQARRLGELARKPLFVRVEDDVAPAALELWRDAGVVALVAPASVVAALAASADAVPAPRRPRQERSEAIIPAARPSDEEEDDEEF